MAKASVSIIICTYNGKSRLGPTLKHIADLEIPAETDVELIVVDNASTDGTTDFVTNYWNSLAAPFELIVLNERRPGKGYAVETGYDFASNEFLVTVDDDNWLDKEYLKHALPVLQNDQTIGALLGKSIGVFEQEPPKWFTEEGIEHFFVIGGPIDKPGYFPENNFGTWGAGTIIRKKDWDYLRSLGFTFLTSKLPGKAAGEDHELGRALLMIGRKFYYSDKLQFRHYMPSDRVTWEKLQNNYETFGYVSHYNFLFVQTLHSIYTGKNLTERVVRKAFYSYVFQFLRRFTIKQHLAYYVKPQHQSYQLKMLQCYAHFKWYFRLRKNAMQDIQILKKWMEPMIKAHGNRLSWDVGAY